MAERTVKSVEKMAERTVKSVEKNEQLQNLQQLSCQDPLTNEKLGDGVKFERIRRITGYLVGTMDKWNDQFSHKWAGTGSAMRMSLTRTQGQRTANTSAGAKSSLALKWDCRMTWSQEHRRIWMKKRTEKHGKTPRKTV